MTSDEIRLLLLRHPETEANIDGRFVGRGDSPYTERGAAQAAAMVRRIQQFDPENVWTSSLRRTYEVAAEAATLLDVPLEVDDRLTELDFGLAEGLTLEQTQELRLKFDFENVAAPVAPEGESRQDIWNRTVEAFGEMTSSSASRIAIVTHGGVFRSAMPYLLGLGVEHIWTFHIRNGQVAEISVHGGVGRLEEFVVL